MQKKWKIIFTANGYDFYFEVYANGEDDAEVQGLTILASAFPDEGHTFDITAVQEKN